MSLILNIETATTVCSVALSKDGLLLGLKELDAGYTHAENLHIFIDEALKKAGFEASQLQAVALSKGPGSYTGLRIGSSTAKGLAFALGIPLISIDTLSIMAYMAFNRINDEAFYCPLIDARRMEVYTRTFDAEMNAQSDIEALVVEEKTIEKFKNYGKIYFFGNGMEKCREIFSKLPHAEFIKNIYPSAEFMCRASFDKFNNRQFEDVAYFEPLYLKDFIATAKKKG
jgi:tRNA threonylcarbamoyladenosine biosynthesis protein TsaB